MTLNLSSDILEAQFGPTAVEVLSQDASSRLILTRVVASGQILELSLVSFDPDGPRHFPEAHQAVTEGLSMGKAFRAAGQEFQRQTNGVYSYDPPEEVQQLFEATGLATAVSVSVLVDIDRLPYAEILEVYSPAVNWPQPPRGPLPDQAAKELLAKFEAANR